MPGAGGTPDPHMRGGAEVPKPRGYLEAAAGSPPLLCRGLGTRGWPQGPRAARDRVRGAWAKAGARGGGGGGGRGGRALTA